MLTLINVRSPEVKKQAHLAQQNCPAESVSEGASSVCIHSGQWGKERASAVS